MKRSRATGVYDHMECLKDQGGGKTDGCQEFSGLSTFCEVCKCHRNYHRKVYPTEVVYTECHKIHRDGSGHGYKDGCKEFVWSVKSPCTCEACGCHKSFHRNEITKE